MIALASDHAGYALKKDLEEYLASKGYETKDFGTFSEESCDYAVYGYRACRAVTDGTCEKAVLVCGTGIGMSLAANKVKGIRCVVCSEPFSAKLSRTHNDSNVLALGSRVVGSELAKMILDVWLENDFDGGRHQRRIDLVADIENGKEL